jgi:hypothetical protein
MEQAHQEKSEFTTTFRIGIAFSAMYFINENMQSSYGIRIATTGDLRDLTMTPINSVGRSR